MKIFIEDDSYSYVTREPYSDDEWDNGDDQTDHNFGRAFISDKGGYDSIEVGEDYKSGDTAFLVIAVWSTGCTFGSNGGACTEIISVHKTKENAETSKALIEATVGSDIFKKSLKLPDGFELRWLPWLGYFESLDYVTIEERVLN